MNPVCDRPECMDPKRFIGGYPDTGHYGDGGHWEPHDFDETNHPVRQERERMRNDRHAKNREKVLATGETLYHGTSEANAHSILKDGFHLDNTTNGRHSGQGVYLTKSKAEAASYGTHVVEAKVDTTHLHDDPWNDESTQGVPTHQVHSVLAHQGFHGHVDPDDGAHVIYNPAHVHPVAVHGQKKTASSHPDAYVLVHPESFPSDEHDVDDHTYGKAVHEVAHKARHRAVIFDETGLDRHAEGEYSHAYPDGLHGWHHEEGHKFDLHGAVQRLRPHLGDSKTVAVGGYHRDDCVKRVVQHLNEAGYHAYAHETALPTTSNFHESRKVAKDDRFEGVGLKQDDDGWYVTTHRARSDSYPTPEDIPQSKVDFIESTGAKSGVQITYRDRGEWGGTVDAHHEGKRVGFLEHGPDGFVENVEVHPEHRRKGIATQMLDEVRKRVGAVHLPDDDPETNTPEGIAWMGRVRHQAAVRKAPGPNGEKPDGIMIAIVPPKRIVKDLVIEGGEDPDNLHVTLGYLGKVSEHTKDQVRHLPELIEAWAETQPKLDARVQGVGTFVNEGSHVLWAAVDMPGVNEMHVSLVNYLDSHGFEVKKDHSFTPHLTLSYGNSHFRFMPKITPAEFRVREVWCCIGGTWQSYPLKG